MFSLLTPYVAYFSGERLHVSGILAVVIAGIYYGWRAPRILSGRMRLQALPVWEMVTFILNGVLFMLIGLQLPQVINALAPGMATRVAQLAIVVCFGHRAGSFCLDVRRHLFAAPAEPKVPP